MSIIVGAIIGAIVGFITGYAYGGGYLIQKIMSKESEELAQTLVRIEAQKKLYTRIIATKMIRAEVQLTTDEAREIYGYTLEELGLARPDSKMP